MDACRLKIGTRAARSSPMPPRRRRSRSCSRRCSRGIRSGIRRVRYSAPNPPATHRWVGANPPHSHRPHPFPLSDMHSDLSGHFTPKRFLKGPFNNWLTSTTNKLKSKGNLVHPTAGAAHLSPHNPRPALHFRHSQRMLQKSLDRHQFPALPLLAEPDRGDLLQRQPPSEENRKPAPPPPSDGNTLRQTSRLGFNVSPNSSHNSRSRS